MFDKLDTVVVEQRFLKYKFRKSSSPVTFFAAAAAAADTNRKNQNRSEMNPHFKEKSNGRAFFLLVSLRAVGQ